MKRYFDFQTMDWSDRTLMRMEEMRWEACVMLFPPDPPKDGVIDSADWQELLVLCGQHWQNVPMASTEAALRRNAWETVQRNVEQDADTLSAKERTLLEKLLIQGGKSTLDNTVELEAALTLRLRLWADTGMEENLPCVRLDSRLVEPLSAALMRPEHFERRMRIFSFDAMINGLLYIAGFLDSEIPVERFVSRVLQQQDSWEARRRARCFIEASYDCYSIAGGMLLLHEGLVAPRELLNEMYLGSITPPEVTPETMMGSLNGLLPEETMSSEKLSMALGGALRPEYNTMEATLALRLLAKQGAPYSALKGVLASMLCVMPSRHMLDALKEMQRSTPRWACPGAEKLSGVSGVSGRSAPGAALLN